MKWSFLKNFCLFVHFPLYIIGITVVCNIFFVCLFSFLISFVSFFFLHGPYKVVRIFIRSHSNYSCKLHSDSHNAPCWHFVVKFHAYGGHHFYQASPIAVCKWSSTCLCLVVWAPSSKTFAILVTFPKNPIHAVLKSTFVCVSTLSGIFILSPEMLFSRKPVLMSS